MIVWRTYGEGKWLSADNQYEIELRYGVWILYGMDPIIKIRCYYLTQGTLEHCREYLDR